MHLPRTSKFCTKHRIIFESICKICYNYYQLAKCITVYSCWFHRRLIDVDTYILQMRVFADEFHSWFFNSMINNELNDSDSPITPGDILHPPVRKAFTRTWSSGIHYPDGLTSLSTVDKKLVVSFLTNLYIIGCMSICLLIVTFNLLHSLFLQDTLDIYQCDKGSTCTKMYYHRHLWVSAQLILFYESKIFNIYSYYADYICMSIHSGQNNVK